MYYHFLQTVLRLNCVGSVERKTQRSRLTRQREPVATRLSRHIVGMRDSIDQVRSDLFTVDQLAARSNFGSSGWQLFCTRLRQHLIGQSKIIRRAAGRVYRRERQWKNNRSAGSQALSLAESQAGSPRIL